MSQYKGYYTAGSSSSKGQSQEADHYRPGGRGLSQEQDCTEYDDGNGTAEYDNGDSTEYDFGDPGGTSAMLSRSRSNMLFGKRSHDEVDLRADRLDQVSSLVWSRYLCQTVMHTKSINLIIRFSNLKSF